MHEQAAGRERLAALLPAEIGHLGADRRLARVALGAGLDLAELLLDAHLDVAAELDVGAAPGHVGGDGHRAGHAGFGDDVGLLLVEAGVQHREQLRGPALARRLVERLQRIRLRDVEHLVALADEIVGELLGLLDRGRADQHRLHLGVRLADLAGDRLQLLLVGSVHLVVLVEAGDRPVGRNLDDVELVDLRELVGLGRGRAGHARQLLVEPEVILEGDRRQRHVLGLDGRVLLRLQRLVQAFRVAPPRHHAAGELVDYDDLVVADDVVLVALVTACAP